MTPIRWFHGQPRAVSTWLAVAALLVAAGASATPPPANIWMTATMDGRKVGHMHFQRSMDGDRVITRGSLDIHFARTRDPLDIRNSVREVESLDGKPLGFSSTTHMSSRTSSTQGRLKSPDVFAVETRTGSRSQQHDLAWQRDSVLNEGMRRSIVAHGFAPGTSYVVDRFDSSSLSVTHLEMQVVGRESVELPGGVQSLVHIRQTKRTQRSSLVTDLWVNDQGDLLKLGLPILGFRLELLACSKACATGPVQDVNVLKGAMIGVPRPLSKSLREAPLRFVFRVRDTDEKPFPATDMQQVNKFGRNVWVVDTVPVRKGIASPPDSNDTAPNNWLESDDPRIHALALKATNGVHGDDKRMLQMTHFVRDYVTEEGASVGYASALETLKSRHGDCTEHAVLLAAMARSLDIPTRVVTGLVYSGHYAGQEQVLVPHTWVQAWIEDAWHEYDAAMPRYDRTHIAMSVGDGDPWKYFDGINSLGRIQLLQVVPGAAVGEDRPMIPVAPQPSFGRGGGTGRGATSR